LIFKEINFNVKSMNRALITVLIGTCSFIDLRAQQSPINKNTTEPIGGQPAPGSKPSVKNLEDQVFYQRAFEAVIWSQPAVGIYGLRRGMLG
jgi:hypothetical protein